jgi:aerobic carbon-monoxide dehydrogenase medium subunit
VPALTGIREQGGKLEIGACTTHHDIASSSLLSQQAPVLAEAAAAIGDPQVRHRGTLGGSLAHADPSADYPAAILALDAEIHVQGPRGARRIAAVDFFRDLFTVDLQPDELIVSVSFAPAPVSSYAKLRQRASHFAIVGVAAALDVRDGVVQGARVGLTGATSHAVRLTSVEQALAGKPASEQSLAAAVAGGGRGLAARAMSTPICTAAPSIGGPWSASSLAVRSSVRSNGRRRRSHGSCRVVGDRGQSRVVHACGAQDLSPGACGTHGSKRPGASL